MTIFIWGYLTVFFEWGYMPIIIMGYMTITIKSASGPSYIMLFIILSVFCICAGVVVYHDLIWHFLSVCLTRSSLLTYRMAPEVIACEENVASTYDCRVSLLPQTICSYKVYSSHSNYNYYLFINMYPPLVDRTRWPSSKCDLNL